MTNWVASYIYLWEYCLEVGTWFHLGRKLILESNICPVTNWVAIASYIYLYEYYLEVGTWFHLGHKFILELNMWCYRKKIQSVCGSVDGFH